MEKEVLQDLMRTIHIRLGVYIQNKERFPNEIPLFFLPIEEAIAVRTALEMAFEE